MTAAISHTFNCEGDWELSTSFHAGPLPAASPVSCPGGWLPGCCWTTQGINDSALCMGTGTALISCYMTVITEG